MKSRPLSLSPRLASGSPTGYSGPRHWALLPLQVLEQARVEIPLFPFSVVQLSFEMLSPALTEEMNKRVSWMGSAR